MQTWTVGRMLEWSAPYFKQKGIGSARLDAEVLLAQVLGIGRLQLYTGYDRPLQQNELARYKELVQRRSKHEPVAYLLGKKGFFDIELKVDKRALIPRPETEQIVILAEQALPPGALFADIGTGSGAITLALLHARKDLHAIATDISADALSLARENAAALGLQDRVSFREGSLLAPLQGAQVAAVLSNPPYVETTASLTDDVRLYEPHSALFAGADGLTILRQLLAEGRGLKAGTLLFFEHGKGQADALGQIASGLGYTNIRSAHDLDGNARILCAQR